MTEELQTISSAYAAAAAVLISFLVPLSLIFYTLLLFFIAVGYTNSTYFLCIIGIEEIVDLDIL